jgi:hypothetical protein
MGIISRANELHLDSWTFWKPGISQRVHGNRKTQYNETQEPVDKTMTVRHILRRIARSRARVYIRLSVRKVLKVRDDKG